MLIKNLMVAKSVFGFLLLILCCAKDLQAQSYIADIQKISVEDGLSSRFVNTIYKDSRGFMWMGTIYGLNRYDGYEFKLYTSKNSLLSSNSIKELHEDNNQKLWIVHGTPYNPHRSGYIDILNLQTGRIQSFEEAFNASAPFTVKEIRDVYSNAGKEIWISTKKGIIYHYVNNRFERIFSAPEQDLLNIFYADHQFLWLYGKELLKINLQGDLIKKFRFQEQLKNVGVDKNNNLWFFQPSKKSLLKIINGTDVLQTFNIQQLGSAKNTYKSGYFRMHYMNPEDDLIWWHQKNSLDFFLVFHPREGVVFNLQDKMMPYLTYGRPQITDIFFDSGKRTWVATEDGIFIITLKKNKFTVLLSDKSKNYSARGITADNSGIIYINSYNGRMRIHPEKGLLKEKGKKRNLNWLGAARDRQGNLWFSDGKPVIEQYNPLSRKSQYYAYPKDTLRKPSYQWVIIRDKTGRVWTGADPGLYYLEPETGLYQKFNQYNAFPQLEKSIIYHLYEDEKGIWIASSSGMYLLEPGRGIINRYAVGENIPRHIPYNHILHFHRDAAGIFWLATKGGGLIRFNPENGSYRQFTTTDGLSNNIIYAVYEDTYGKLWLSSNYGLMQFDKKSYRVNTYLTSDGIAHAEFNIASHYQSDDGRLYFGGLAGVTVFDPGDFIIEDHASAPLQIINCQVLNGKTAKLTDKTTAVSTSGELVLSPSDRSFIIDFALLNYESTQQNVYAYKIEGLDKDWNTINNNSLRINSLPYGNYILHIKGQGIKGQWSKQELVIPIIVHKPFYKKNGFIFACVLVFGLITYGTFRWRLQSLKKAKIRLRETVKQRTKEISQQKNKIERQAIKLKELDSVKSRFFANISHELRTPLTLILGYIENMLQKHDNTTIGEVRSGLSISRQNGYQLLTLTEEILELSKLQSGQLKVYEKPVAFYPFISRLSDAYRSVIIQKQISFSIGFHLPYDMVIKIDEGKFGKIIHNLLSNAAKYTGPGGRIQIDVTAAEPSSGLNTPHFQLQVSDTGRGIHAEDLPRIFDRFYQSGQKDTPAEGGTGIGLALAKELTGLIQGTLTAKSSPGKGSTFTLRFPATIVTPGTLTALADHTVQKSSIKKDKPLKEPHTNTAKKDKQQKPVALLVEDHPEMRVFIKKILKLHYHITEATDGIQAMEILHRQKPDIIISDVMMPRLDGFGLLKKIREKDRWKDLPFIMLTARAADEDKLKAFHIGVDDYLTKPFQPSELIVRMQNLVKNYRLRQQWAEKPGELQEKETLPAFDREFIQQATAIVEKEIANSRFGVIDMAEALHLSQRQLSRKMQRTTGLSPLHFIREIRLKKAQTLLENKEKETVAEVMYAVGIQSTGYFAKIYFKRFGKQPSAYTS